MTTKNHPVSMLFSDLKGYSGIKNDELKVRLVQIMEDEITKRLLNPQNHIYVNTWGDAFFICSDSPTDLAEIALQMRDLVINKDWQRLGFPAPIMIRIGLHIQSAQVLYDNAGHVKNVIGVGVDKAARLEPQTEPNKVFCSSVFHEHIAHVKSRT